MGGAVGVVIVVVVAGRELVVDEVEVTRVVVVIDVGGVGSGGVVAVVDVLVVDTGVDSVVGSNAQLVLRASKIARPERKA